MSGGSPLKCSAKARVDGDGDDDGGDGNDDDDDDDDDDDEDDVRFVAVMNVRIFNVENHLRKGKF